MKEYWSRRIRDAVPYVPGEQPRGRTFIKLNTNENPYPPSPKVVEAVKSAAGEASALSGSGMCRAACSRRQAPWGNTGTGFPGKWFR